VGEGKPEAVALNEPALPAVKVVVFALVKAGGITFVRLKVAEGAGPAVTPKLPFLRKGETPSVLLRYFDDSDKLLRDR